MNRRALLESHFGAALRMCWLLVAVSVGTPMLQAGVELHGLFSDHAVLQQGMAHPVWGKAGAGQTVTVEFQDQKASATADADGRWRVTLQPLRAGGPFTMVVRDAAAAVEVRDLLVGEVWVCSGQSNMAWGLGGSESTEQIAKHANLPRVRLLRLAVSPQGQPREDVPSPWSVCTPHEAYSFSAVGYYFGRDLHQALDTPVGLIQAAVGGTYAHTWMPARYLEAQPQLQPLLGFWDRYKAAYQRRLEQYQAQEPQLRRKYEEDLAKAKAAGTKEPSPPAPPGDNPANDFRNLTASNYNGMIHPLQPYPIRGVLWYQGENDAGWSRRYRVTLPTMIRAWRETWGCGDFAFLIVQLPAFGTIKDAPGQSHWAQMRESQAWVAQHVPGAGIVTTIDCGNPANPADLHPPLKEPIGQRLALLARAKVYGQSVEHQGPVYRRMKVDGHRVTLEFDHAGGLVARGDRLTGFAVAGEDRKFVAAAARIEGDHVVVSSDQVPHPVAVRYGWADYPLCNLYNAAGLPAAPFRTDDWAVLADE